MGTHTEEAFEGKGGSSGGRGDECGPRAGWERTDALWYNDVSRTLTLICPFLPMKPAVTHKDSGLSPSLILLSGLSPPPV